MRVMFSGRNKLLVYLFVIAATLSAFLVYVPFQGVHVFPVKVLGPLELIRLDCGELCETVSLGEPGPYFNQINVPIDCHKLFQNELIDRGHNLKQAPKTIPKQMLQDFTMNGRISVSSWYFDQYYSGKEAQTPVWTKKMIDQYTELAKHGELGGNYGVSETNALRDGLKHAPGIKDGRVLVIGSEIPWVEACVLEAGAREVVTLEYGIINSEHPQIKTMVPSEFRKAYLTNTLGKFDAIVTFSSVEHSGLGRYALNPWGDIITIARGWCVTKDGGSLTVGVMYDDNKDSIRFNAGRWYGQIRYPFLATNWKQHYRGSGSHRVHVFTKDKIKTNKTVAYYLHKPFPYNPVKNANRKYSQVNQDQLVYKIFPKKQGFFLEMGAFDGKKFSNTLWLERKHNWTGLLIEANPDLCRKIDSLKRHAWRLCACVSNEVRKTKFIQNDTLGKMVSEYTKHMKLIKNTRTVTVPCFTFEEVLGSIDVYHIDYFSLDVEGAEMVILNSLKKLLFSKRLKVDIWTIEYRVFDSKGTVVDKSLDRLVKLRLYFEEIGQYVEHSQVSEVNDNRDGMALDVIFVSIETLFLMYREI